MGAKLIEAEQQLSGLPDLERRLALAEDENARLQGDVKHLKGELASILASPSWRLTAPLRRVRMLAASRRRG